MSIQKYMARMRELFCDEDLHVNVFDARGKVGHCSLLGR